MSLRESIKNDIITPLPDEYHIFWCIGEVWKRGKNLFIYFSENAIAWTFEDIITVSFLFGYKNEFHEEYSDDESKNDSKNQGSSIHRESLEYNTMVLSRKIKYLVAIAKFFCSIFFFKNHSMLRLVFTEDSAVRDSLIRILWLERKEGGMNGINLYQKNDWLLLFSPETSLSLLFANILEMYLPERLYLPTFGRSVDLIHERWDIILPNVFLSYNPLIETTELTKENQDSFLANPEFLTLIQDQKDYYVEDFGLSVWGIVVDKVPQNPELNDKLLQAYEADVYVEKSLSSILTLIKTDEVPIVLTVGVIDGKPWQRENGEITDTTMRNMVTTWKLLEEENE